MFHARHAGVSDNKPDFRFSDLLCSDVGIVKSVPANGLKNRVELRT